ncbi:hypothetical protein [Streptacidiphilus melanogenes]|uniref:hypothetical protein n=1 Tax=Streptacidiphilus melanogenes TaxID=411235 RepID=UPI0005AA7D7E|nr:hypothetical protein [Streptacidiphilus melanogenes]
MTVHIADLTSVPRDDVRLGQERRQYIRSVVPPKTVACPAGESASVSRSATRTDLPCAASALAQAGWN